jgi:hypothetical protein
VLQGFENIILEPSYWGSHMRLKREEGGSEEERKEE